MDKCEALNGFVGSLLVQRMESAMDEAAGTLLALRPLFE